MRNVLTAVAVLLGASGAFAATAPNMPSTGGVSAPVVAEQAVQEAKLDIRWHHPKKGRTYVCVRQNGRSTCSVER